MNFIEQVKHWAGLGLDIDVDLPRSFLPPGRTLVYNVTLRSEETVQVRALLAEVVQGTIAPGHNDWGGGPAYCAAPLVPAFEVQGGVPHHIAGSITLPPDLPLTANKEGETNHWSLRITADIAGGRDPSTVAGFVVGPAHTFPWQIDKPIRLSTAEQGYAVTARGECTVVQMEEHNAGETRAAIVLLINVALADLLKEQPAFLTERDRPQYLRDLGGALQDLITPRVRAAAFIPVDSVLDLTVAEITVERV